MAIDSRAKRASVLGVGRPWIRIKEPDATKGEDWRIASGNAYGGNTLSAVVSTIISQARSVSRFVSTRIFGRVN